MSCSAWSTNSIEAVKHFFVFVDFAELGVLGEPPSKRESPVAIQVPPIAQEQPPQRKRAPISGQLLAPPVDGGEEQAKDVKLVGDQPGAREEGASEHLERLTEVEDDETDIFSSWNVAQRRLELRDRTAVDDFHHPLALEVDQHGNKLASSQLAVALEVVLVDADDVRPRIEPLSAL